MDFADHAIDFAAFAQALNILSDNYVSFLHKPPYQILRLVRGSTAGRGQSRRAPVI
jgi:hypothetical protein